MKLMNENDGSLTYYLNKLDEKDERIEYLTGLLRDGVTHLCSYCMDNRERSWDDMQLHIGQCEAHPLYTANKDNAELRKWNTRLVTRVGQLEGDPVCAETEGEVVCVEDDGCPTEGAVLKREWRKHTAQLNAVRGLKPITLLIDAGILGLNDVEAVTYKDLTNALTTGEDNG